MIAYRKNKEFDVIKIEATSYCRKIIMKELNEYMEYNKLNHEQYTLDIVETIPTVICKTPYILIQFAIIRNY